MTSVLKSDSSCRLESTSSRRPVRLPTWVSRTWVTEWLAISMSQESIISWISRLFREPSDGKYEGLPSAMFGSVERECHVMR